MKKLFYFVFLFATLFSCQQPEKETSETKENTQQNNSDHLLMSVLWYQTSAEMRAISYQTYRMAKMLLDKYLENAKNGKPNAIILDIDETVLDNSPYEARCIERGTNYAQDTWNQWTRLVKAKPLPGSLDFLNYAKDKGVEIFYVSNRSHETKQATIDNLRKYHYPNADSAHILLKKDQSSKEKRRQSIAESYEILLLLGDNLKDFSDIFARRGSDFGFAVVDSLKNQFGQKFIVFPNPMYGEWEKAVYKNSFDWSEAQKDSLRRHSLTNY